MPTPEELAAAEKAKADEEAAAKQAEQDAEKKLKSFEAWVAKQPDEVKALYEDHVSALKGALESERKTGKEQAKQLKRLAELEAEAAKRKEAEMTETEKIKAELAAEKAKTEKMQADLNTERVRTATLAEIGKRGYEYPEDVYQVVMAAAVKPEIGDDRKITNVVEALDAFAKARSTWPKVNGGGLGTPPGRPSKLPKEDKKPLYRMPSY